MMQYRTKTTKYNEVAEVMGYIRNYINVFFGIRQERNPPHLNFLYSM